LICETQFRHKSLSSSNEICELARNFLFLQSRIFKFKIQNCQVIVDEEEEEEHEADEIEEEAEAEETEEDADEN
jgi:hypothetical protein